MSASSEIFYSNLTSFISDEVYDGYENMSLTTSVCKPARSADLSFRDGVPILSNTIYGMLFGEGQHVLFQSFDVEEGGPTFISLIFKIKEGSLLEEPKREIHPFLPNQKCIFTVLCYLEVDKRMLRIAHEVLLHTIGDLGLKGSATQCLENLCRPQYRQYLEQTHLDFTLFAAHGSHINSSGMEQSTEMVYLHGEPVYVEDSERPTKKIKYN